MHNRGYSSNLEIFIGEEIDPERMAVKASRLDHQNITKPRVMG